MVYFFTRQKECTFCVLDVDQPSGPFRITVVGADGSQQVQVFDSADEATDRWNQLQNELSASGWEGPLGRDPRF